MMWIGFVPDFGRTSQYLCFALVWTQYDFRLIKYRDRHCKNPDE
jgi:hypothetical protein